jgi:membrane-bound ClpP family serine protease
MGLMMLLLILGAFFLVAELVFLPGVILGATLSLASYGGAVYMGFAKYGLVGGFVTIAIVLLLSLLVTVLSLRAKTWQRFALKDNLDSTSGSLPSNELKVGDAGIAISRLSPMGKVEINGKSYEAKSVDAYIDPKINVQVVGFENFTVIVRKVE